LSAVRELTRVAVQETEREWLDAARGKSVRQLEELVAGKRFGDTPAAPSDPSLRRHVLRFEVEGETLALFRRAVAELRQRLGSAPIGARASEWLSDDAVLLEMARLVLGGPHDEGRASYQVAMNICGQCGGGNVDGGGEPIAVGPEVVAMAHCDGQHIGEVGGVGVEPANDAVPQALPAQPDHDEAQHIGGAARTRAHVGARATQTIPPAVRRAVMRRDGGRCRVPGCRNATFVDVHHIDLRSEGGGHRVDNLLTVCGAHHRALHRGTLSVERDQAQAICFRHADGTSYGEVSEARELAVLTKVFGALRRLGFREVDIRRVLAELRGSPNWGGAGAEAWIRAALQRLTRPAPAIRGQVRG
jgi:hypothetical protein